MTKLEPPTKYRGIKIWVDEAIWGHRLYNDQTPWLVFLEFLSVFRSRSQVGYGLKEFREEGAHENFSYDIPRLIPLRELVFNNPHVQHIDDSEKPSSEKWDAWLAQFNKEQNFSFLKDRFGDFSEIARVIELFQSTAVEPHRQRRWTSRFLFPYGPYCLYADLPNTPTGSPDRRFFARGGELLYLMLSRSGSGPEIAELISNKLLREEDTWNRLAKAMLPNDHRIDANSVSGGIGYLPYAERDEYKQLAHTWRQLLSLDLPSNAVLDPLVRLSALHMLLYMLRRAGEETGQQKEPKFVLEIAAPKKTTLFEISAENLHANRMLSSRAVRAYVDSARDDPCWQKALEARAPAEAVRDYLTERFLWDPEDGPAGGDPDAILESLRTYAETRHGQHVAKVHLEWTRQIGMSVSRRGVGVWYAPNDSLIKALVMCTVEGEREEYHRFLANLYERFRIIVAAPEAEKAYGYLPTDQYAFTQNAQRLEQRLRTLGLLRRLSDDCAYVENPFRRRV
ncbi:hypothetical protein [uncultured Cohaesibacter sp.]|uniref:hypothetical protein n=1 Tax=uncultured Cohaesibacter sp. TaxID=1002546 RepID=UPI0029C7C474|nr:hypothetical protein [uncultured Cohaesibacter sp.]